MYELTADHLLYGILVVFVLQNALTTYILSRQVKVYQTTTRVPQELERVMDAETFDKARLYGLHRTQYMMFMIFLNTILHTRMLYYGFIATTWKEAEQLTERLSLDSSSEIVVTCVFSAMVSAIGLVVEMAIGMYRTFVLEEMHGFNKQTFAFFIIDQLLQFVVSQIIGTTLIAAIVFTVQQGGKNFFIWLWLLIETLIVLVNTIGPMVIDPLFNKFTPMEEGALKSSIEELVASMGFPLTELYVVDGSKRSAHSNAYFTGFWNSKKIVLYDTLLKNEKGVNFTDKEILAIICHELGHWKLGHLTKYMIIMQMYVLVMVAAFVFFFDYGLFYQAVGFPSGKQPIYVGFILVMTYIMGPFNSLINLPIKMLSRRLEFEADEFSHEMGFSKPLSSALVKVHSDNLEFPVYDHLYSSWFYTHPTLLHRLDRLKELDEGRKTK